LQTKINSQVKEIELKVIDWRRHFHQFPELSNHEVKTGARIAEFLKSLGMEVHYPVAITGVVGILKGAKPGPVIALRADMDALPITERNSLPFASKEKVLLDGRETGAMHACGHDTHMAMLMGAAEILSKNKNELRGTVKFLFQPAEEGLPAGEEGGAYLMIKEGVLENPKVDVVFGLHIMSWLPLGTLGYRPGPLMAAVDGLNIKVTGRGAHGATPWESIDPIVVASQIINGIQTIVSRQTELTKGAAVITIGSIHAGIRRNIIPEEAKLEGTIRTFDPEMQNGIHERITRTATKIAESAGASAEVSIFRMFPVTFNDPHLTEQMLPTLQRTIGKENVKEVLPTTGAEDFSFFQQKVPGLFIFLGANPADMHLDKVPGHHTPDFMIDERSFVTGVNALLNLTLDYMFLPRK
jgi:amidohydrolase